MLKKLISLLLMISLLAALCVVSPASADEIVLKQLITSAGTIASGFNPTGVFSAAASVTTETTNLTSGITGAWKVSGNSTLPWGHGIYTTAGQAWDNSYDWTGKASLSFYINPLSSDINGCNVGLFILGNDWKKIYIELPLSDYVTANINEWQYIVIPFSDFNTKGILKTPQHTGISAFIWTALNGVEFSSETVTSSNIFRVSDLKVTEGGAVTPPQPPADVDVTGVNDITGANTVTNGQTSQYTTSVIPSNATNKGITWSVINGTGSAAISTGGLLFATAEGTVTIKASANGDLTKYNEKIVTITAIPSSGNVEKQVITTAGSLGSGFNQTGLSAFGSASIPVNAGSGSFPSGVTGALKMSGLTSNWVVGYYTSAGGAWDRNKNWAVVGRLDFWIKPLDASAADAKVGVFTLGGDWKGIAQVISLADYIDIGKLSEWQQVKIPFSDLAAKGVLLQPSHGNLVTYAWNDVNGVIITGSPLSAQTALFDFSDVKIVSIDPTQAKADFSGKNTVIRPYEKIEITFDKEMDTDTFIPSNFGINGGAAVSGMTWGAQGRSVELQFSTALSFNTSYIIQILDGLKGINGNSIDSSTRSFTFTTSQQPLAYITDISASGSPNVNMIASFNTSGDIFAVLYDSTGNVKAISYAKQSGAINASFTSVLPSDYIDVFMWDSISGMLLKSSIYRISSSKIFIPTYGVNPTAVSINDFEVRNNTTTFKADISGKLNASDKSMVPVILAKADFNLDTLTSGTVDLSNIVHIENILSGSDGSFKKSVSIANSASYTVYAGIEKGGFAAEKDFLYVDPAVVQDLLSDTKLNAPNLTAADAKGYLENTDLGLILTDYNSTVVDKDKVSSLFVKYKISDFSDVSQVQVLLDKAVGMVLLDKETDAAKMADHIAKYGASSEINASLLSAYNTSMVSSVKNQIVTLAMAADFSDETKINQGFGSACAVALVNSPANTWGIIKNILTVDYSSYVSINPALITSAGVDEASVYKGMLNKNYANHPAMEADYLSIIASLQSNKPSSGSAGGGGGGTRTVSAPPVLVPYMPELEDISDTDNGFDDLGSVSWAVEAINILADKGVISRADKFRPNDNITRAEFTKLVIMGFSLLDSEAACEFSDVSENDWSYSYIASAKEAGIVNGMDENTFAPDQNISRQDMAVIIYKAIQAKINASEAEEFADQNEISDYAKEAVMSMKAYGIVNGMGDNLFVPKSFATRAEASVIIHKSVNAAK